MHTNLLGGVPHTSVPVAHVLLGRFQRRMAIVMRFVVLQGENNGWLVRICRGRPSGEGPGRFRRKQRRWKGGGLHVFFGGAV